MSSNRLNFLEHSEWGNGTILQTQMITNVISGELVCSITGLEPSLESPSLFLAVDDYTSAIMRYRYNGASTKAKLLMRSGE